MSLEFNINEHEELEQMREQIKHFRAHKITYHQTIDQLGNRHRQF